MGQEYFAPSGRAPELRNDVSICLASSGASGRLEATKFPLDNTRLESLEEQRLSKRTSDEGACLLVYSFRQRAATLALVKRSAKNYLQDVL